MPEVGLQPFTGYIRHAGLLAVCYKFLFMMQEACPAVCIAIVNLTVACVVTSDKENMYVCVQKTGN
jgi:hypothetical protein